MIKDADLQVAEPQTRVAVLTSYTATPTAGALVLP